MPVGDHSAIKTFGSDPQNLIPHIVRDKIFASRYWKEHCFALNAETLLDTARHLDCVGFMQGGLNKPTAFICLLAKLLQISPGMEIVKAYLHHSGGVQTNDPAVQRNDLRYVRALAASYLRMVGNAVAIYTHLEPLLADYRKVLVHTPSGKFERISMDQWIEMLLSSNGEAVYGMIFPKVSKRKDLESRGAIRPYIGCIGEVAPDPA